MENEELDEAERAEIEAAVMVYLGVGKKWRREDYRIEHRGGAPGRPQATEAKTVDDGGSARRSAELRPQTPVDDGGSARRSAELRPQTPVDDRRWVVWAVHADDEAGAAPGGGRSLELWVDRGSKKIVRELGFT
jgi:hypothetical protein